MSSPRAGNRGIVAAHAAAYSLLLVMLAVLSWLGDGWGYFVVYGAVLAALVVVVGVGFFALRRASSSTDDSRANAFLWRSLRSFVYAQVTLATALIATAVLARLTSGPLGPFPGTAFEGAPSEAHFEEALPLEGDEVELQIPADPPYTITTHAFEIDGSFYVGADFVFPFKRWVYIVQEDPEVLIRIGGRVFRRRAAFIQDRQESRRLLEELSHQRGHDPDDWLTDVWFFRMDAP